MTTAILESVVGSGALKTGSSLLLGVVSAMLVFMLVVVAVPGPNYSPGASLIPPVQKYASVRMASFNITSMSATYEVQVHVVAKPLWNVSEPVYLRISSELVYNEDGTFGVPPGPYDIVVTPGQVTLNPGSSVVFNVTFIPWPSATDLYAYTDVTFIWGVGCLSYGFPMNGVALGGGYIFGVKGVGVGTL